MRTSAHCATPYYIYTCRKGMFRIKTGVSHVLLATRTNSLQNETSIYKQDNQVEIEWKLKTSWLTLS